MKYLVNGAMLEYEVSNKVERGDDIVLLDSAIDLTIDQPWHEEGYFITNLFNNPQDFIDFRSSCVRILHNRWREAGLNVPENFPLEKYHELTIGQHDHLAAVEKTRLLFVEEFPLFLTGITERVANILGREVEARNPYDGQRVFHFRVIRPQSGDNNPLHRDVWLEDYKNCINVYIPVAGSNERSSLILLPGSHRWPESRITRTVGGAVIGSTRFNVPAVASVNGSFVASRPDPGFNEFLLFSPYLIHGGATNLNLDETRISIELRLWPV